MGRAGGKLMRGGVLGFLAVILLLVAPKAQAENCALRDQVVELLTGRFGETQRSIGVASNNSVVEIWASEKTGTWTLIVTLPSGISCAVASGQSWMDVTVSSAPEGDEL